MYNFYRFVSGSEILQHFTKLNPRLSRQIDHESLGYLFHLLFNGDHVNSCLVKMLFFVAICNVRAYNVISRD